nr:ribosome biogenesis protein wdr12 like [Quercus suber]
MGWNIAVFHETSEHGQGWVDFCCPKGFNYSYVTRGGLCAYAKRVPRPPEFHTYIGPTLAKSAGEKFTRKTTPVRRRHVLFLQNRDITSEQGSHNSQPTPTCPIPSSPQSQRILRKSRDYFFWVMDKVLCVDWWKGDSVISGVANSKLCISFGISVLAADSAPRQHQHVATASATTLMQLKLQLSAADSAPGQHQCVPNQARHFDDVIAGTKATSMKIEELSDCLATESSFAQLKRIKNCTDTVKQLK